MRRLLLLLVVFVLAACRTSAPDLILAGGKVFTADDAKPWAEAIAIRGERIAAVGSNAEVRALAGPSTRVIELAGRVVVPGINDAHVHEPWSVVGERVEVADNGNLDAVLAALGEAVRRFPEGTRLDAGIAPTLLDEPRLTRDALDALTPKHPVTLSNMAGHVELHNSAALRMRGIGEADADPAGGWYGRKDGRLTGWVYEHALWSSDRRMGEAVPDETYAAAMRAFAQEAIGYGITSVQSMPAIDAARAARLAVQHGAPLRWRFMDLQPGRVEQAPRMPMKYIVDGTPMERGAAMRMDYADQPGHRGRLNYSDEQLRAIVATATRGEQPLLLHISGDLGIEKLIAAMRATPADWPARRVRLEHGDFVGHFLDDVKALGIVHVQNPSHFMLPEVMHMRLGTVRDYQAARSVLERGIPFAIGSDGPINPWLNVMFAGIHPRNPAEALTREQAVTAYTRGSAYAEFAERDKGTLTPGKLADLAVLTQDVFTIAPDQLPGTRAALTIVGGRVVWGE